MLREAVRSGDDCGPRESDDPSKKCRAYSAPTCPGLAEKCAPYTQAADDFQKKVEI